MTNTPAKSDSLQTKLTNTLEIKADSLENLPHQILPTNNVHENIKLPEKVNSKPEMPETTTLQESTLDEITSAKNDIEIPKIELIEAECNKVNHH